MTALAAHFPAFASRDFRMLWFGTVSSSIARWTLFLGSNWLAYDISGSSLAVGLVSFASTGAYIFAPLGGWLSDRYDRRFVMATSRGLACLGAVVLTVITFMGFIEVWQLVLVGAVTGFARATEQPAEQALLPNTLPPSALLNGMTLAAAAFTGSRVVGPIAGAPLLATVGAGGVFAVAAAAYLVAMLQTARIRVKSTGDVEHFGSILLNLRDTAAFVVTTPPVLMVFGLVVLHCWLTMSFDSLLPEFATKALDGGELEYNQLLVAVGAGSLIATLFLSTIGNAGLRGSLFLLAGIGSGLFPLLIAFTTTAEASAVAAIGIGASQGVFMALSATLLQAVVPDGSRGRVMSLYVMLAAGVMSLMNLGNGILADEVGTPVLFAVPGFGFAVILIAWSVARSDLRRVYRTGELEGAATPA